MDSEKSRQHKDACERYLQKVADAYILSPPSVIHKPKAVAAGNDAEENPSGAHRNRPVCVGVIRDWPALLVSIGTLVLLVFTVLYARKQWLEANRSAVASEKTAEEAQTANQYTFDIIKGTQEAIVRPQIGFVLSDMSSFDNYVAMNFINGGKVNAGKVNARAVLVRKTLTGYKSFGDVICAKKYKSSLAPVGQAGSDFDLVFDLSQFTQSDVDAVLGRSESIEIKGTFSYDEGSVR